MPWLDCKVDRLTVRREILHIRSAPSSDCNSTVRSLLDIILQSSLAVGRLGGNNDLMGFN